MLEKELLKVPVVTLGGGTGHFALLNALKRVIDPNYITAIPGMSDDGGDSGRLRTELGVLPPGDPRQCMLALASYERQQAIADFFNFRFLNDKKLGGLAGRNIGNINIAALEVMYGCQELALLALMDILNIPGRVIPASHNHVILEAKIKGRDEFIKGESNIDHLGEHADYDRNARIEYIRFDKPAYLNPNAREAIKEAEWLVIAPGDLYTSILPIFLINGLADALMLSKAKIIYCGNLLTKNGETHGFTASNCLAEVKKYIGDRNLDYILLNHDELWPENTDEEVKKLYQAEGKDLIHADTDECAKLFPNSKIIEAPLARYVPSQRIIRHDRVVLADEIRKIMAVAA